MLEDGAWRPHVYPDVFGWEEPYLVAAPAEHPLRTACSLLDAMTPPFRVELEVLESRGVDVEEGANVLVGTEWSREDVVNYLTQHEHLLESDARLAVLIHGSSGERVVYDEHNRLLLTGSTTAFEAVLLSLGFVPGEVAVPMPHVHQYRDDLTPSLSAILAS